MWVAGADGCQAGWLVVFRSISGQSPRAQIFKSITDAFKQRERLTTLAVDIPIGLLTTSRAGGRPADIEARKVLSLRKSSIFPPPSRPVLKAKSPAEAKKIEKSNSDPPKSLAKQVINLLDKIRELDAVAAGYSGIIFECHPEVSFWEMNQKTEMSLPKRKTAGFEERCKILAKNGYDYSFLTTHVGSYKEQSRDDLLDACAAAWTAERIFRKQAIRFPARPCHDDCGLDMVIWA
jgi:predicted RNase H-like nuclease